MSGLRYITALEVHNIARMEFLCKWIGWPSQRAPACRRLANNTHGVRRSTDEITSLVGYCSDGRAHCFASLIFAARTHVAHTVSDSVPLQVWQEFGVYDSELVFPEIRVISHTTAAYRRLSDDAVLNNRFS